jgi:hypothetical protein
MDRTLVGTVVLGVGFLPYLIEVVWQVRLLPRFLAALPETTRATLPPHPSRPLLAVAGSTRFFLALWRCFRRDVPSDPAPVIALKRQMRASLRRGLVWGAGWLVLVVALLALGWRPIWP